MDISSNDRSAMMPNYSFPDLVPEKASGSRLWDENGKEYIDFGGGIAVTSLGHCHPVLMKSMEEQSKKLWHVSNYLLSKPAKELGQKIASKSFADKVLFSNSGNEANEAAIKLARKYFFEKGDEEKYEILSFTNSFHGRSLANITLGDSEFHQTGFGPLPKGFIKAEFNNIEDVKKKISNKTAAIIVELIQGEAGVISAQNDFVEALRNICNENNILLIFDEVQCGLGRTGKLFAHHWSDIKPDIMTIAKAIGNGFPLGACLTSKKVGEVMDFGSHGSTFGGNPLASVVGNSVLDIMLEESFFINLEVVSKELFEGLAEIQNEFPKAIDTIRGKGLMIGIRCNVSNSVFVDKARSNKLLTIKASDNVVRLLPPLILKSNECKEGLSKIKATCEMF